MKRCRFENIGMGVYTNYSASSNFYIADNWFIGRTKPNSAAVDRGVALPNVNEGFTGRAPDLGALEVGKPVPHFGARP